MTGYRLAAVLTGAAMLTVGTPAHADAPVNGRIAYTTFESSPNPANGDIWTMNPDGSDKLQAVFDSRYDAQSDWSPDGTKIVFRSSRGGRFQIAIADFSVAGRPRITDIPPAADGSQSSQPSWFPDGRGIMYRRSGGTTTTKSDIYAMNVDGTNRRPIYVAPDDQWYPAYSPDMTKVLFSTSFDNGGRNIQVLDVATGQVKTLFDYSDTSYDSGPAWSPDGSRIAFESDLDGDMDLYLMNADGSNVQPLTQNTVHDEGAAWSPDGKQFAFSHGADNLHLDIWTMNVDGSDPRQLTTYEGRDESPDWDRVPYPVSVGGTVQRTLTLSLGPAPSFGTFVPGVAHDYDATMSASITSTAGDATLTLNDPGANPGHLVNAEYVLSQPLLARANDGAFAPLPATLLSYTGPVSNDPVTLAFRQPITATEPLLAGDYRKTLTLSLSTTNP